LGACPTRSNRRRTVLLAPPGVGTPHAESVRHIARIMKPDLYWIPGPWPGRLAIMSRPRGGDWLQDEAKGWRQDGIDVVVSLLEPDEAAQLDLADEAEAAVASGIRFMSFPIPDRGVPASASTAASLIAAISDGLERGENVAVHCRQGLGRSGLIAAGVLASAGIDPERAIEAVSSARGQTVPETAEQRSWVQRLASRVAEVTQPR
jgi:protein-tyrosine phosphatase